MEPVENINTEANLATSVSDPNLDKVSEYFKIKKQIKTFRDDLKDIMDQMDEVVELKEIMKKVKELREKIKEREEIRLIKEKASTLKERLDLLKELIRLELIETAQQEVKKEGRKLKLIYILKEMKENEEGGKKKGK